MSRQFISPSAISAPLAFAGLTAGFFTWSGIQAIRNPTAFKFFGLPIHPEWAHWVPVLGSRNLSFGVAVLALVAQGQQRAVGTLIVSLFPAGFIDMLSTYREGAPGSFRKHVMGSVIIIGIGAWNLLTAL